MISKLTIEDIRVVIREELEEYHRNKTISEIPSEPSEDLLTIDDAASFLRLSKNYLYILVHKKSIPFIKRPGTRRIYFSKSKLLAYLTNDDQNLAQKEEKSIEFLRTRKRRSSR